MRQAYAVPQWLILKTQKMYNTKFGDLSEHKMYVSICVVKFLVVHLNHTRPWDGIWNWISLLMFNKVTKGNFYGLDWKPFKTGRKHWISVMIFTNGKPSCSGVCYSIKRIDLIVIMYLMLEMFFSRRWQLSESIDTCSFWRMHFQKKLETLSDNMYHEKFTKSEGKRVLSELIYTKSFKIKMLLDPCHATGYTFKYYSSQFLDLIKSNPSSIKNKTRMRPVHVASFLHLSIKTSLSSKNQFCIGLSFVGRYFGAGAEKCAPADGACTCLGVDVISTGVHTLTVKCTNGTHVTNQIWFH